MRSSKISLSTFLACFALLAPRVSCQTDYDECTKTALFASLVSSNLTDYADLVCTYAPEITKQENTQVYAPNNPAVQAYLASNPQPGGGKFIRDMIFRRSVPDPNANAAAKGNTGTASNSNNNFGSLPPRGAVGGSGSGSAKVSKPAAPGGGRKRQSMPPLGYVGSITAGGGGTAFVLEDAKPYGVNSYYYEIDRYASQYFVRNIPSLPIALHRLTFTNSLASQLLPKISRTQSVPTQGSCPWLKYSTESLTCGSLHSHPTITPFSFLQRKPSKLLAWTPIPLQ